MNKRFLIYFFITFFISFIANAYNNIYITGETNSRIISRNGGLASFLELPIDKSKDLVVDTGNILFPNRFTFHDNGEQVFKLYKDAGFALTVMSNHDFDFGVDNMKGFTRYIDFISANYSNLDPYKIVDVSGIKVAFIGMTKEDLDTITKCDLSKEFCSSNSIERLKDTIKELSDKCQSIILLSNETPERTIQIVSKLNGIDHVFVGSKNKYSSILYKKMVLKNDCVINLIPEGFTHVYKGKKTSDNKIDFKLLPLKKASITTVKKLEALFPKEKVITINNKQTLVNKCFDYLSEKTNADVIIFNQGIINPEAESLKEFIKYDGNLHLIMVNGKELKKAASQEFFYFYGIKDGKIYGRKIIDDHNYRVLINDYSFNGGDGFEIKNTLIRKNIIKSYKSELIDKYDDVLISKRLDKKYILNKNQFFLSYSQFDLTGNSSAYNGVSELTGAEKEDYRFEYKVNFKRESKNALFNNDTEFYYEKTDGVNNERSILIQSKYDIKKKNLVFFQKINTSLLENASGDKTTNYRLSIGKMLKKELYAGLSYQQVFPENGADANYGLTLTWDSPVKLNMGVLWKRYIDLFYSKTGDEYYEGQLKTSFSIPFYKKINLEMSYERFLVYDDSIGDDAGNSKYFLGVNYSFKTEDFIR